MYLFLCSCQGASENRTSKKTGLPNHGKMGILTAGSAAYYSIDFGKPVMKKTVYLIFIKFWNFILTHLCHNASNILPFFQTAG